MFDPAPVRRSKRVWAIGLIGATLLVAGGLSSIGLAEGTPGWMGTLALGYTVMASGGLALFYFLGAMGFGALFVRTVMARSAEGVWLSAGVGIALMLWMSHALGVLGLLSGARGRPVAIGVCAIGVVLLVGDVARRLKAKPNLLRPARAGVLWVLPLGVMVVAASNAPGWLWRSEASGYDALSYHLQLPQEWAQMNRLRPVEHNVYSYLPSYMEAGYLHIAAMTGAGMARGVGAEDQARGLVAGDGAGVMACQWLHAMCGVLSGLLAARVVASALRRAGVALGGAREAGAIAGAAVIATPWVIVCSSLAYNESAVNALFAAGWLAAMDRETSAWKRGLVCGLLVGAAVGCKPTAAFMVAPGVGLALLMEVWRGARAWSERHTEEAAEPAPSVARGAVARDSVALVWALVGAVAAGMVSGAAMVAPFLVRNWWCGRNPLFPAATGVFGMAHWTSEQVARFASGHSEHADLIGRIALLFAWSGNGLGNEARGIWHSQWLGMFPIGVVALLVGAGWKPTRSVACVGLCAIAAGVAWWVGFSHCQSRFLLPLVVPLGVGVGLTTGWLLAIGTGPMRRLGVIGAVCVPLMFGAVCVRMFLSEGGGRPNAMLTGGTAGMTGEAFRAELRAATGREQEELRTSLPPSAYVDLCLPSADRVYLLGDGAVLYFTGKMVYHTTWDAGPLAKIMRMVPDDGEAWVNELRARGIDWVLVNYSELARLQRSGWADPLLTPERVAEWLRVWGEVERTWEENETVLYHLRPTAISPREKRAL